MAEERCQQLGMNPGNLQTQTGLLYCYLCCRMRSRMPWKICIVVFLMYCYCLLNNEFVSCLYFFHVLLLLLLVDLHGSLASCFSMWICIVFLCMVVQDLYLFLWTIFVVSATDLLGPCI